MLKSTDDSNLIFIFSQPRSGSTMLQFILANHPEIATTAEPWLILPFLHILEIRAYHPNYRFYTAQNAVRNFLNTFPNKEEIFQKSLAQFIKNFYSIKIKEEQCKYFLDKTPLNYLIIPEIFSMFPNAKYIFLLRNPLAVLYSILDTWVGNDWYRLSFHKRNLLEAPFRLLEGIELLGKNANVINYERIIEYPKQEFKNICNYLEIKFIPDMIYYGEIKKSVTQMGDTKGIYEYHQPDSRNINKWHGLVESGQSKYLAKGYMQFLGKDILEKMGYEIQNLEDVINKNPSPRKEFIIRWNNFFPEKQTYPGIFKLILMGFLKTKNFSLFLQQTKRLLSETFLNKTEWYG